MNKPSQSSRRASDLSLEQLYRKRAIDRENQRNLRQRNKGRIVELEAELQKLREELEASQRRESNLETQLSSARTNVFSAIATLQSVASTELRPDFVPAHTGFDAQTTPESISQTSLLAPASIDSAFPHTGVEDLDADFWSNGGSLTFPIDSTAACDLSDFSLDLTILAPSSIPPYSFQGFPSGYEESFPGNNASQQHSPPVSQPIDQDDFNAARQTANALGAESPIWSAVPRYTPPTTSIDKLIVNLIETRKVNYQQDADVREFSHENFPSVNSLLNPSAVEMDQPVASTIAKHVMGVIRVHTLPEKLALLYIMCVLIRWQVLPTEAHYDAIPEFSRPTRSQITTPHPPWVGTIGWPKAREQIIRHMNYTQYPKFASLITKTFSINWPHSLNEVLERGSERKFVLTDLFVAHLKDINNWTVGKELVNEFPFLDGAVNVRNGI